MTKHNTPALRFDGFDGEWETSKIADLFAERVESFPEGELLSVTTHRGIKRFEEIGRHDTSNADKSKYKLVGIGDIAYNSMRMWQGASGVSPYRGIVSPAYTVLRPIAELDSGFFSYLFKVPSLVSVFKELSQGLTSDTWNLKFPAFSEIDVTHPAPEEQRAIGELFSHLDALIEQHRAKHANLQQTKTALMQRMFPQDGADEPELRLGGFSGAWEIQPFSDLVAYRGHNSLSRADLTDVPTSAMNIHYGDILVKYDSVVDVSQTDIPFVRDVERLSNLSRQSLSDGDILFADAAEDSTVGKCVEVQGISDNLVLAGLHTISARPIRTFAPGFLGHALNAPSFHNQLLSKMQGTKVSSISISTLAETVFSFPTLEEQRAIGEAFSNLDALIAAEYRYITQLAQAKAALLQRMFV